MFEQLATIEAKHQDRIFEEYQKVSKSTANREEFEKNIVATAMEGGMSTEEYLGLYQPDLEIPPEVVSLAMAIEAQALDLYQRAAERAANEEGRAVLRRIADEERAHLEALGELFEDL